MKVPPIYFVIPAAGVGSRMQQERPKQYLPLKGEDLLTTTVRLFLKAAHLHSGVIVHGKADRYFTPFSDIGGERLKYIEGGASRAESVYNGLQLLVEEQGVEGWVIVHDAARPGLSVEELNHFIRSVLKDSPAAGGIMALPAQDTLKVVEEERIRKTLDRSQVWQAQTPQMFPLKLLYELLGDGLKKGLNLTDEASVLEYNGLSPQIYRGYAHNFKITYPEDLTLMRLYLEARDR